MNSVEDDGLNIKNDIDKFSDGLLNVFDACKISHLAFKVQY